jgi:hypothetical protein
VLDENENTVSEIISPHCELYTSSKKVPFPTFCSPPPKKKPQRVKDEGGMAKYQF